MAGDTVITVVGNLTADPELRFTPSGAAVANFTVASTPRTFDKNSNEWKDGEALFLRCTVWRQAAENVAESLHRGAAVIVQGRLKQRSFETKEGEKRTVIELDVEEVGPSLKFASAQVNRNPREGGSGGGNWGGGNQGQGGNFGGGGSAGGNTGGGAAGAGWGGNQGGFGGGNAGGGGNFGGQQPSQGGNAPQDDPWNSAPPAGGFGGGADDEPPF